MTNCVFGAASMSCCTTSGMLSGGVEPPREHLQGQQHEHEEQAKLRHGAREGGERDAERGDGEKVQRRAGEEERDRALDGHRERPLHDGDERKGGGGEDHQAHRPILLALMISSGVTGIARRCSRMSAAPVSTTASRVTLLMTCMMAPNQALSSPGLKRARSASSTGGAAPAHRPPAKAADAVVETSVLASSPTGG